MHWLFIILFVVLVILKATVWPLLAWTAVFMPLIVLGLIILIIVIVLLWFARMLGKR